MALNAKIKNRNDLKRLERVCPMALNARMEENGDGSKRKIDIRTLIEELRM